MKRILIASLVMLALAGCTSLKDEYNGWALKPYSIEQQRKEQSE